MKPAPPLAASGPKPKSSRFAGFWPAAFIVLAGAAAYANSFSGPFIFDDRASIIENSSIRHFGSALTPPADAGVGGRPLLNLTFALNYALGGVKVWGYHAVNWLIHTLAGLTLFGLVRRTLTSRLATRRSEISNLRFEGSEATSLALAVAVIWTVHPLQTEAVTYVSQRAESLMGLFYMLTLYCFVRSADETGERQQARGERPGKETQYAQVIRSLPSSLWSLASIFACFLGVMCKETIVTAPMMVFLYDRTFVAGSFLEASRRRWRYYLGLASTWLLMACLMVGLRQRSVGFDQGTTWQDYALTSCQSVVRYLELAIWPHPLIFDYGFDVVHDAMAVLPFMLVLVVLVAGVVISLWRWPLVGFAGAWFFLILAPTTSIVPIAGQPMAEHRMYLSLAAVVVLIALALHRLLGRRSFPVLLALAAVFGWLTSQRNETYRTEERIWRDTVASCPDNERAHYCLGSVLAQAGRIVASVAEYEEALRLKPDYPEAHNNLGDALFAEGRTAGAIAQYEEAVRLKPSYAEAHDNLGIALKAEGRTAEAIAQCEEALRLKPDLAEAHKNLGDALKAEGRTAEAIAQYEKALRLKPDYADAHINLGNALSAEGRTAEAIAQDEEAVRLKPDSAEAHNNLGSDLSAKGWTAEAIAQYEEAVRLKPDLAKAHNNLGDALGAEGRTAEAIAQYEEAVRLQPDSAPIHFNLALALLKIAGRTNEAVTQLNTVLRLQPDNDLAREILTNIAASGP